MLYYAKEGSVLVNSISLHIGKKIKLFRKIKSMTLEDLSRKINKSIATLSKYENGSIYIDIETLFDIADALDCNINQLTDYINPNKSLKKVIPHKSIFGSKNVLYMYLYKGNHKIIQKSVIHLNYNVSTNIYEVTLYMDVNSFEDFHNCEHLYFGVFKPFDTLSYFQFENQANDIEQLSINVINPLSNSYEMYGLLSGISGFPFLPSAGKVLLSKEILTYTNDEFIEKLTFKKEEIRYVKKFNMIAVDR